MSIVENDYYSLRFKNLTECEFKQTLNELDAALQLQRQVKMDETGKETNCIWFTHLFFEKTTFRVSFKFQLANHNDEHSRLKFAEQIVTHVTSFLDMNKLKPCFQQIVAPAYYEDYRPLESVKHFDKIKKEAIVVPFSRIVQQLGEQQSVVKLCLQTGGLFYALRWKEYMPTVVLENLNGDTAMVLGLIVDMNEEFYAKNKLFLTWFFNMDWYNQQMYNPKTKYSVEEWIKFEINRAIEINFACETPDSCEADCCDAESCEETADVECCKDDKSEKDYCQCSDNEKNACCDGKFCEEDLCCCPYDGDCLLEPEFCHSVHKIRAEKKKMLKSDNDDKTECKICFENEMNCVLMPCKHLAVCDGCATELHSCPICRSFIETKTVFIRA